ncbi:MAG: DNA-binding response regulator [Gemmatimonadetes bacterium]|nr:MAG: DNA-binding response regulator [Gemmatimonadota bacterium]
MRLLVVEDDRKVASFLAKGLREEGYAVDVAHDGEEGLLQARVYEYDALVLDLMLPGRSGLDIVRELRADGNAVPVLLLTARDSERDVVVGLDVGADDYLRKPFGFEELLARLRALVRRGGSTRGERLFYADLELDRIRHRALRRGVELDLTPREYQLLEYFMLHPEQVVRRTRLLEKVWDMQFDPMSNVVDVHIGNLRRKLAAAGGGELLHTVRGVGYVLQSLDEADVDEAGAGGTGTGGDAAPASGPDDEDVGPA